jgi:hypothetical protein
LNGCATPTARAGLPLYDPFDLSSSPLSTFVLSSSCSSSGSCARGIFSATSRGGPGFSGITY